MDPSWIEARLEEFGAPVVEGDCAIFVWRGARAPVLKADFVRDGEDEGFVELEAVGVDLWAYRTQLPMDAYVQYHYELEGERMLDPFNARKVYDGVIGFKNYVSMPEWQPTTLLRRRRGVARGRISKHTLEKLFRTATTTRDVFLYEPAKPGPHPLLVVFDGNDYLSRGRLAVIVDNLIGERRIRPIAMAMLTHGKKARFVEYDASEATLGFLEQDVLPLARKHLELTDELGEFGVLGASMGGLMAVYAAMRLPEIFGKALSQSGALGASWWGRTSLLPILIERLPRRPIKIWMDVGVYDFLLEANREMAGLMARKGYDFTYREYNGAHNYTCWRNDISRGLELLFPAS